MQNQIKINLDQNQYEDQEFSRPPSKRGGGTLKILIFVFVLLAGFAAWKFYDMKIKKSPAEKEVVSQEKEQAQKQAAQVNQAQALRKEFEEKLPKLKEEIKKDPENLTILSDLAVAQYATGDTSGAQESYLKILEKEKNIPFVHNNLANIYRDQGDYTKAEEEYLAAINLDPRYTISYINLGSIFEYIQKDNQKAISIYEAGIEANPDYIDFYNLLGKLYAKSGNKIKAEEYFQKSLEIQEDNPAAKQGLEDLK